MKQYTSFVVGGRRIFTLDGGWQWVVVLASIAFCGFLAHFLIKLHARKAFKVSRTPKTVTMDEYASFDPENLRTRWVAYFDLLGITELLNSNRIISVFEAYSLALKELGRGAGEPERLGRAWFSDTFVLWSKDDSPEGFRDLDLVARWFTYFLLQQKVPFRGAISCGEMYVDERHRLFFGKALLEAYQYGEAQDWIGLVLTPSAAESLQRLGLLVEERWNYVLWDVPLKSVDGARIKRLGACLLGGWIELNGRNPCADQLRKMMERLEEHAVVQKYVRTLDFIAANRRGVAPWPSPSRGEGQKEASKTIRIP